MLPRPQVLLTHPGGTDAPCRQPRTTHHMELCQQLSALQPHKIHLFLHVNIRFTGNLDSKNWNWSIAIPELEQELEFRTKFADLEDFEYNWN